MKLDCHCKGGREPCVWITYVVVAGDTPFGISCQNPRRLKKIIKHSKRAGYIGENPCFRVGLLLKMKCGWKKEYLAWRGGPWQV